MVHPVQVGKRTRMSFAKVKDVAEMPNLIEIQLDSYKWFLDAGLYEVFDDINPISNFTGNLVLEFVGYTLDMDNIKYSVEECKERDTTYAAPLKVAVRLQNKETGEIKEQEVFMGDFPLMTEQGTFIINGAERVIVSQLVRSPGVYYNYNVDKTGKKLFSATVIPNRGAWLEYETDSNDVIYVRIDKTRKLPISILGRAMGFGSDQELLEYFGEEERFKATIEKDNTKTKEEALLEIYKRLRPGEPPTVDSAISLIDSLFFDAKRYDLSRVGRYKFNKKLAIGLRIANQIAAEDIVDKLIAIINNQSDFSDYIDYFTIQPKSNIDIQKQKKLYNEIIYAYITKRKIRITYDSLTSGKKKRVVHPYGMFNYKGDIYMVAYCENRKTFLDFKICRISEYEILEEKYNRDSSFNWDDYSKNCMGIYKDGEIYIILKIKYPFSAIIKEKIWVDNQEILENEDKSILFKATMKGYSEIKSWILSMGANVEVIKPEKLREDIICEIEKIKKLY